MSEIKIESIPDEGRLSDLGVNDWAIWEKDVSEFPWTYDADEVCYFLEGEVLVTPEGGESVKMAKGDLVTFPGGMSCHWVITKAVRKHYKFL